MNKDMHQNDELTIKETLDQAATAIKDGEIALGKSKLELVLQREPNNVLAWLWMSRCFQDREIKLKCFKKVLEIDPKNKHALEGIRAFSQHKQVEKEEPALRSVGVSAEDLISRTVFQDHASGARQRKASASWKWLILGVTGTVVFVSVVGVLAQKMGFINFQGIGGSKGPASSIEITDEIVTAQAAQLTNSPTQIYITTPIPLTEIDLNRAVLTADDLTFSGLHTSSDWKKCSPSDNAFYGWIDIDSDAIIHTIVKQWRMPDCDSYDNYFSVEERILVIENSRQAARIAESIEQGIERRTTLCGNYESQTVSVGDSSIWIIRGEGDCTGEWSRVMLIVDEAIIFLDFKRFTKLAEDDLLEIAEIAVNKVRSAQYP